jgi:type II secretory pathway component GspD/PulD (secretin)
VDLGEGVLPAALDVDLVARVPKTTSNQASTTVIVKDGETFVLGGLITELESDTRSQVPLLGSIPLLGHLFKKTSTSKTRGELLVFVTPKIIPF